MQQFKECGLRIEASSLKLSNVGVYWRIDINFFVEDNELIKSEPRIKSVCSAVFEGFKEDLKTLTEQLKGCGFNFKTSDFYPSYPQADQRMISRLYVEFEVAEPFVLC